MVTRRLGDEILSIRNGLDINTYFGEICAHITPGIFHTSIIYKDIDYM